jgi:sister-chromatid-cohesion protein PDS5
MDQDEEKITRTLNFCVQTLTGALPSALGSIQLTFPIAFVYMNDHKASEDLHSFAKLNQDRLYKLLKTCFNPQTDIKTLGKSSVSFFPVQPTIIFDGD